MKSRPLGALMVLAAFALLIATVDVRALWPLPTFLALLVPGALLAGGIIGPPGWVVDRRAALRRDARARPADSAPGVARAAAGPPERVFRYPRPSRWVIALFAVLAAIPLTAAAFIAHSLRDEPSGAAWVALVPAAMGVWLPLYLVGRLRAFVRVGPDGIAVRRQLRTRRLAWDDIIALSAIDVGLIGTGPIGRVYRVYGPRSTLSFDGSIDDAAALATLVARASGLGWE